VIGVTISHISKIYFNILLLPRIFEIISFFILLQTKFTRNCNPLLMSRPSICSCCTFLAVLAEVPLYVSVLLLNADYTEWLLIMTQHRC
jgi:hypothetical protein